MSESSPTVAVDRHIRQEGRDGTTFVVQYHDVGDLLRDYADELSSGRVFLPVHSEHAPGASVVLVLSCPGLLQPLRVEGVVAANIRKKKKGQVGLSIDIDEDARRRLAALVERIGQGDPAHVVRVVRVLVVDDNPHCAKLLQEGLRLAERRVFGSRVAFDVPTAATAADALAFLRKKPIDVLISDIYLGGASGATIIEHIRAHEELRSILVIAISAGQDEATREVAVDAGADVFLEKPLRLKQVVGTVGSALALEQVGLGSKP